jgi:hypothetical protein
MSITIPARVWLARLAFSNPGMLAGEVCNPQPRKAPKPPRHKPTRRQPTEHLIVVGENPYRVTAMTRSEARGHLKKRLAAEAKERAEREAANTSRE